MAQLTQEQWDALAPEEQEKRQDEKPSASLPEVKEDVVVIDGKPRPLKNFIAEMTRKVKEEVLKEVPKPDALPKPDAPKPDAPKGDFQKKVLKMAEDEMAESGSVIPINTILSLISQGTNYHITQHSQQTKASRKVIKETKKELKAQYKNFADYEDEFDEIVDTITPQNISKEGLKIVYNSLRGKNLDEILKKEREAATKKAEEDKEIIGDLSKPTEKTTLKPTTIKLSQEQMDEMKNMGFETEADYIGRLNKFREVAKRRNAKNVPNLLSERLNF